METVMKPSYPAFRNKIAMIEAIELSSIGFVLWSLIALFSVNTPASSFFELLTFLLIIEGILLGSWGIYNAYIRIARAGGKVSRLQLYLEARFMGKCEGRGCNTEKSDS